MSDEDLPEVRELLEASPAGKAAVRRIGRGVIAAAGGLILLLFVLTLWRQHGGFRRGEEDEARALGLTYDAVRLAPRPFWGKPVLWRLGCRYYGATTCYSEGDLNKPVLFPQGTQLSVDGHKGMSFCLALGRIQRVDAQGVYLELLQSRGTRE